MDRIKNLVKRFNDKIRRIEISGRGVAPNRITEQQLRSMIKTKADEDFIFNTFNQFANSRVSQKPVMYSTEKTDGTTQVIVGNKWERDIYNSSVNNINKEIREDRPHEIKTLYDIERINRMEIQKTFEDLSRKDFDIKFMQRIYRQTDAYKQETLDRYKRNLINSIDRSMNGGYGLSDLIEQIPSDVLFEEYKNGNSNVSIEYKYDLIDNFDKIVGFLDTIKTTFSDYVDGSDIQEVENNVLNTLAFDNMYEETDTGV